MSAALQPASPPAPPPVEEPRAPRRPGRPPWIDPAKAALARQMLLAGRRPGYVRRKTGLSHDGVRSVIEAIRRERRQKETPA